MSLRANAYRLLESTEQSGPLSRYLDIALIVLIALNVVVVAIETVPGIYEANKVAFIIFDTFSVGVFTVEYVGRVWVSREDLRYQGRWGRLRYMLTPMAVVDFLAIAPFYLAHFIGVDLRFLRAVRMLRVFKLTRYSSAMNLLLIVLKEEASTLLAGFFILFIMLILAASGAYIVEHNVQPEAFGSIPESMWWALVTLTTVGYGDVTPITPLGRMFGGLVTVIGIGVAALPAGIIASGLADHVRRRRDDMKSFYRRAFADGELDEYERLEIELQRKRLGVSREVAEQIREEIEREAPQTRACSCPRCGHEFLPEQEASSTI